MQIIGSFQIVTFVTSVIPTFFELHCAFLFFHFAFRFFVLIYSLDCAGEFRLCGGDHGLCPLDSHKPLKRLDRNFKCFGAVTFAWFSRFCAVLPSRLPFLGLHVTWARPPKKRKNRTKPTVLHGCCLKRTFYSLSQSFSISSEIYSCCSTLIGALFRCS